MKSIDRKSLSTDEIPKLLNVLEAASILNIGTSTLYQLIQSGELRCVRMGRSVRIDPSDLLQFIEQRKSQPTAVYPNE